jgi:hypothetical protein
MTYMENLIPEDYPDFEEYGAPPCSESFPDAFFAEEKNETLVLRNGKERMQTWARYDYEKEAKAICAECPYKSRCLEYALKNYEIGIWGGTTDSQRTAIRRSRKAEPTKLDSPKVQ